jgi:hypothetical protein
MNASEIVIEEIREGRRRMSEQCGHDLAKYIELLKSFNDKYSTQVARYRMEQAAAPVETVHAD